MLAWLIGCPSILSDVQRLYHFLAGKNPDAARRTVKAIRNRVKVIAQHTEIGCPTNEIEPEYRERLSNFGDSGYTALYHYGGHTAVILTVHHQKEAAY